MYHSLIFVEKKHWGDWLYPPEEGEDNRSTNTWDAWKIVPSSRPVFNPPKQKTQYLDIPGADGALDISEALTGYPVFENREGSIEFLVTNDYDGYQWSWVYEQISNFLHGQEMRCILEDDPGYFYEGRFQVNQWSSEKDFSKITIDYNVKPYKYELINSINTDWLWDPFNFETGFIMSSFYRDIRLDSDNTPVQRVLTYRESGLAPFCPQFLVTLDNPNQPIFVRYRNNTTSQLLEEHLYDGSTYLPEMMVFGGNIVFSFYGHGRVSLAFSRGRL